MKSFICIIVFSVISAFQALAASSEYACADTLNFRLVETDREIVSFRESPGQTESRDTIAFASDSSAHVEGYDLYESMAVSRGVFSHDWTFSVAGGVHAFFGDRSVDGKFSGTISPEFTVGVGKWLTDCIGVEVEFTRSESRGYTRHITGDYGFGYGPIRFLPDGTPYRAMKTLWWNIGANVMVNLSRLVMGYEGMMSRRLMNQFFIEAGGGCLHHLNYNQIYGNGYEWSAQIALRYSRFFSRRKNFSLDVKARWLMCFTNFDFESKAFDRLVDRIDSNVGISLGVTYYLGKKGHQRTSRSIIESYETIYR